MLFDDSLRHFSLNMCSINEKKVAERRRFGMKRGKFAVLMLAAVFAAVLCSGGIRTVTDTREGLRFEYYDEEGRLIREEEPVRLANLTNVNGIWSVMILRESYRRCEGILWDASGDEEWNSLHVYSVTGVYQGLMLG